MVNLFKEFKIKKFSEAILQKSQELVVFLKKEEKEEKNVKK